MVTTANENAWKRIIILMDINACFAAIEQRDFPQWRGQPLAVTNGTQGSCIITCSYEARAYGIKTGMRLKEAKEKCPQLIVVPARHKVYAKTSQKIMEALFTITPDIEVFSIDEAFLDLTYCQRLHGTPEMMGQMVKQKVYQASGLLCSIGISGDKTTAKYAAKLNKPNGLTIIPPWEAKDRLKNIPVIELCGIGEGISRFLAKYGVYNCGDMEKLPIGILAKRFGNVGRRLWYMCQGADPEPVRKTIKAPQSMGHGKVMPPNTKDKAALLFYLRHMSEKLAARLRSHHLQAKTFYIGWKSYQHGWLSAKSVLASPTHDGQTIYKLGQSILEKVWRGQAVYQVQVTALDPQPEKQQYELFAEANTKREQLNTIIDQINARYGELAIAPAPLLKTK